MRAALALSLFTVAIAMRVAAATPYFPEAFADVDGDHLSAMIYRGKSACDGCPESVQALLETSYSGINVSFAGPDEETKINLENPRHMDIFVQPGGPVGVCTLEFALVLFSRDPITALIFSRKETELREIEGPNAQVNSVEDTVIQVDWTFASGKEEEVRDDKRWLYFQDGAAFVLSDDSPTIVLARYSQNGDVASTMNALGNGWVANVGPHVEADQSWYDLANITNPEGIKHDIGVDFIRNAVSTVLESSRGRRSAQTEILRYLISAAEE